MMMERSLAEDISLHAARRYIVSRKAGQRATGVSADVADLILTIEGGPEILRVVCMVDDLCLPILALPSL